MSSNLVSWKDYEGLDGFGQSTAQEVDALNKALTAGDDINPPGSVVAGDGFALRVESLENTLKSVIFRMEHILFFKNVPKLPAYNTVEEFNQLQGVGENPDAGFIAEGDLPEIDDSKFERKFSVVKFMGTTRKVSHVMSLVKPAHSNVLSQETVHGTMHLMRMVERAMFYGDSSLSTLQFDGFRKLLRDNAPAANIIDMRGQPLTEDVLTDASLTVQDAPNYGQATHLYLNPRTKSDLVKTFFPKERYDLLSKTDSGMIGLDIKGYTSPAGDVVMMPDVFITDGGAPNAAAVGDATKIPATPTVSTAPTTPVEATAQFGADDAGDYFYQIVAVNRYGRSAAVVLVGGPTAVTVAAGDKVTWAMTPGSAVDVDWYDVYRTKVGGASGTERLILRVPNAAGAGAQTIDDLNAYLPNTTNAFLFQQNLESISCKQLAPLLKIPLATIDSSIRWMQLIYLTLSLYAPGKNILFENIGRSEGFVGTP